MIRQQDRRCSATGMSGPDPANLCVGVVVPSAAPAAWITEAVAAMAATGARIVVRLVPDSQGWGPRCWRGAICAIGGARMVADPDAAQPLSSVAGVTVVEDLGHVDVVFHVGVRRADAGQQTAPLGVWELSVDERYIGLRETLEDAGAVPFGLRRVDGEGWLRPSGTRVQRLSPATTRARALWAASALPARALRDLTARRNTCATRDGSAAAPTMLVPLSMGEVLRGAARLARRAVATGIRRRLARNEWFVATSIDGATPIPELERMTPLVAPRDRFWADPFPVVDGDRACIFVEEWLYGLGRGVLAVLEIERDGSWRRLGTVLEQPWHLSHPFVFGWQGETWMMPESSAAGTLELYRCVDYPLRWERECLLMQDLRIVDATLHETADHWWLFGNIGDGLISTHEELHLFFADSPLGPWTPHPANPVVADPRVARPAGGLFEWDGRWCRPAQDCGVRYGSALWIHEIVELTPQHYSERPRTRLEPGALAGANRMHTLNRDGWLTVVDGHRDRWRLT